MVIKWQEEMNPVEGFMRNFFESAREGRTETGRLTRPAWVPAVDAWETEDDFHMVFDVPGVTKEGIEIEVEGDQLTIKGDRKIQNDIKYIRKERVFGPFFRQFNLETPIEREKIKAVYKNGVLEVILPKKEEVKPKQIQIQIEEE